MNARYLAWRILGSAHGHSTRVVERRAMREGLEPRERALVRRIVTTAVRRRTTLRVLVEHFAERKPKPALAALMHVGLVQALFLDGIPDHALVAETVDVAQQTLGPKKARALNAFLRNVLRARKSGASGDPRRDLELTPWHLETAVFVDRSQHPLVWAEEALGMPVALVKRWTKRYGSERAVELARIALVEPDLSIRIARGESDDVITRLASSIGDVRRSAHPRIVLAPMAAAGRVVHDELFTSGAITVQGESALRAAELVGARSGERVLDLCAAPGGKTAVLAASGASIVAVDDDEKRAERLRGTLARLVPDASVDVRAADGATGLDDASFDAALVDAPCSNTGVLAARPSARWRFSRESQAALALLQTRLLADAARCVRHGGRLVYSTCSIEPEENQRRVRAFLDSHAEWALEREIEALPAARGTIGPVDGGYAALVVRGRTS